MLILQRTHRHALACHTEAQSNTCERRRGTKVRFPGLAARVTLKIEAEARRHAHASTRLQATSCGTPRHVHAKAQKHSWRRGDGSYCTTHSVPQSDPLSPPPPTHTHTRRQNAMPMLRRSDCTARTSASLRAASATGTRSSASLICLFRSSICTSQRQASCPSGPRRGGWGVCDV
jgi:hypothetical protein